MANETLMEEMKKHILWEYKEWIKSACDGLKGTEEIQKLALKSMESNLDILIFIARKSEE